MARQKLFLVSAVDGVAGLERLESADKRVKPESVPAALQGHTSKTPMYTAEDYLQP